MNRVIPSNTAQGLPIDQVIAQLQTSRDGLTTAEAMRRLATFGHNGFGLLKHNPATRAEVLRDHGWGEVTARELVPGDIVRVTPGSVVPADIKVIAGDPAKLDEADLTGELAPVTKTPEDVLLCGTVVQEGELLGVVTVTGVNMLLAQSRKAGTDADRTGTGEEQADDADPVLPVLQAKAETKAFYDRISGVYDFLSEHSEEPVRRAGLELLAAQPDEAIIEIGFGTGHSAVALAKAVGPGGSIHGIDISDNMVDLARELAVEEGVADRLDLRCGDATRLPFGPGSMDAVFMSFTLELFDTPQIPVVLAECRRVLRPGGRIVVVGLSKEAHPGLVTKAFEWAHRHLPRLIDCRPIHVAQAIRDAGFRITVAHTAHWWVPVEIVLGERSQIPLAEIDESATQPAHQQGD